MKKSFVFLLFLFIRIFCIAQTNVSEVELDWNTKKFNNNLPWDVPFQIRIVHLPSSIKNIRIKVLELEKDYKNFAHTDVNFIDSAYYETLPGQDLGFKYADTVNVITVKLKIKPNTHYLMNFYIPGKQGLNEADKDHIKSILQANRNFQQDVLNQFNNTDFFKLSPSALSGTLYKYVKSIDGKYELDTSTVTRELSQNDNMLFPDMKVSLMKIAQNIKELKVELDKNALGLTDPDRTLVINNLLKYNENGMPVVAGTSMQTLSAELDDLFDKITKEKKTPHTQDDSVAVEKIENKLAVTKLKVQSEQQKIATNYDTWINDNLVNIIAENVYNVFLINSSTPATMEAKAATYIAQSVGLGYSVATGNFISSFTYSFFFRPVNQDIQLSEYSKSDWWKVRFCLNVGMTIENISSNKNGKIGGIVGDRGLIIGAGFRLLSFLKLDMNGMFYTLADPNPLIDHKKVFCSFLPGLSLNLNIARLLAGQNNSLTEFQNLIK